MERPSNTPRLNADACKSYSASQAMTGMGSIGAAVKLPLTGGEKVEADRGTQRI